MKRWIAYFTILLVNALVLPSAFAETANLLKQVTPEIATQLYNPEGNTIAGNPDGDVTLVEFFDYNCPFCRGLQPTIKRLIEKNPNLRVVYKEYLLFGDSSIPATSAALAAAQQNKYLAMHQALMTAQHPLTSTEVLRIAKSIGLDTQALEKNMLSPAVQNQIAANNTLASSLNMKAAPAFIVTSTPAIKSGKDTSPQFLFMGSDDAERNLQMLIDKAGNKG